MDRRLGIRNFAFVAVVLFCSGTMLADWSIEVLESQGVTGYWTSIKAGSDGLLHIAYRNDTENALMHAWQLGDTWACETIDYCDCAFIAMALDDENIPRITYWEQDQERICHVQWDGSAWQTDYLGPAYQSGYYWPSCDIKIDTFGRSHVVWYDGSDVRYAVKQSTGSWSFSVVDSAGNTGVHPSLILDETDHPVVSYGNIDNGHLYLAAKPGSSWMTEIVDPCENASYTSIAMDSFGYLHILYYALQDVSDSPVYTVSYASWEVSGWEVETAATGQYLYPSSPHGLCLDASNNPHICTLYADMGGYLSYRCKDSTGWHQESVEGPNAGYDSAICLDSLGRPNISYFYWGAEEDLHWARRNTEGVWSEDEAHVSEQDILTVAPFSNPMCGSALLNLRILESGMVAVRIYDTAGRLVYELPGLELSKGTHQLAIGDFGSGLFFCVADAGSSVYKTSFIVLD